MPGETLVRERSDSALGADRWGLVVVEVEPELERKLLLDPDVEDGFGRADAGLELGVEPLDAGILQQKLKALLECVDVERRPGGKRQAVPVVAGAQPPVALELGCGSACPR